jgi:hypothetical protein
MVDTDRTAWTQRAGNGEWLSVECAGFTPNPLTPANRGVSLLFQGTITRISTVAVITI